MSIATFGQPASIVPQWKKCGVLNAKGDPCEFMLREGDDGGELDHFRQFHPFKYHESYCPSNVDFYWRYDYFRNPNDNEWFHGLIVGCDCCNIVFFVTTILPADINVANLDGR